jgi:hypothetical protein
LNKDTCDWAIWDLDPETEEKVLRPDPDAIAGSCPYYEMDQSPLMTAGARQAAVQRMAEIAKGAYPDHLMVQVYMRVAQVEVPIYRKGDCEECEENGWCEEEPESCEYSGEALGEDPVGTEPGEFTKFVVNIQTRDKLTDQEGVVRMQEIQNALQQFNDDEVNVENCLFEINFVHVKPAPPIGKVPVPDTLPENL